MRQHVNARRQAVIDIVHGEGTVAVSELSRRLNVHAVTIRRDLDDLVAQGQIERRHGFVSRPARTAAAAPASIDDLTIGLVVPVRDYYFGDVIKGVRDAAAERDAQVRLRLTEYDEVRDSTQVRQLLDAGVDGILFTPWTAASRLDEQVFARFEDRATPIVVVERAVAPAHILASHDAVYADHRHGVAEAVRHLHRAGRSAIAMVTRENDPTSTYLTGYHEAMSTLGLQPPIAPLRIATGGDGADVVAATIDGLETQIRTGVVDGLVVQADADAIEVVDTLSSHGIDVPGDVAVVAYDDEVAELARIPLTAVSPPKREVGRLAVAALERRIAEARSGGALEREPVRHQAVLPSLTIRRSTP